MLLVKVEDEADPDAKLRELKKESLKSELNDENIFDEEVEDEGSNALPAEELNKDILFEVLELGSRSVILEPALARMPRKPKLSPLDDPMTELVKLVELVVT